VYCCNIGHTDHKTKTTKAKISTQKTTKVSNTNPHQKPMGKQLVIKHMPRKRLVIDRGKKNIYVKTGNYYIFDSAECNFTMFIDDILRINKITLVVHFNI
jgi:hypothetical protein